MTKLEFTGKIDALRLEIAETLEKDKIAPKDKVALKEILQLLSEAADTAEENEL